MDEKELRYMALEMHYRGVARQAFRFIQEIGGPEALDRYETLIKGQLAGIPRPAPEMTATIDYCLEALEKDMSFARREPDLI